MPGIPRAYAEVISVCAGICLKHHDHVNPVELWLDGDFAGSVSVEWLEPAAGEVAGGGPANGTDVIRYGAECLAIRAVERLLGLAVIMKAPKRTGIDFWLGDPNVKCDALREKLRADGADGSDSGIRGRSDVWDAESKRDGKTMNAQLRDQLQPASELHTRAMELADRATILRLQGRADSRRSLVQAFELERDAADVLVATDVPALSRSVFHRSAASLAIQVCEWDEAARLIEQGLRGNPPSEIAAELEELKLSVTKALA
jgi:hypothetical protein